MVNSVNVDWRKCIWEIEQWQRKNFPDAKSYQPLLGAVEELGELAHSHLKQEQGIRGTWLDHFNAKVDAVGDVIIYLIHYCRLNGFSYDEALTAAWGQVRERNWVENPLTGRSEEPFTRSISELARLEEESAQKK